MGELEAEAREYVLHVMCCIVQCVFMRGVREELGAPSRSHLLFSGIYVQPFDMSSESKS
jgi:hypothetical protein